MLKQEAQWLGKMIYSLDKDTVFPLLNLGSSSKKFREKQQPWIYQFLFKPAQEKGNLVIHADLKQDVGVDLIGNLNDTKFLKTISELNIQSVICSNLLEHIVNKEEICQNISSIIPVNGYLFVTVPYQFPLHLDPIDTLFRPNINQLCELFPELEMIEGEIISGGKLYQCTSIPGFLYVIIMIMRLLLPFYQPLRWLNSFRYSLWLFRDISVTCIVFKKTQNIHDFYQKSGI
ncbi:methyltransferase type 11 [Anabaena sp. FACHB-1237]|uniref:methyltransferase type 11 n=1 Tax=Anabaena sp. FACHB-1237 TaxID=2692769 RepID=UPI0016813498|nr:methyltransferase type 11 [Anabaena sp. FACHB-1237]MBD2138417.1 methyltransferase type 11 [Anabaena sp. FACHB-1237]